MMIATSLPWVTLALVTFLMLLQFLDVVSTNRVLSRGGREFNPIIAWIMQRLGRAWWMPKFAVVSVPSGFAVAYANPRIDAALAGIAVAYVVVVANNFFAAWQLAR
jgi:hypothetical protein